MNRFWSRLITAVAALALVLTAGCSGLETTPVTEEDLKNDREKRRDNSGKYYRYKIRSTEVADPLAARYEWHLARRLNRADYLYLWGTTADALREYSPIFEEIAGTPGGPAGLYDIVKAGDDQPPRLVPISPDL